MEKENILKRLDKAFLYLDRVVPQAGVSVDMLADSRRELRVLWAELNRSDMKNKDEVKTDG